MWSLLALGPCHVSYLGVVAENGVNSYPDPAMNTPLI